MSKCEIFCFIVSEDLKLFTKPKSAINEESLFSVCIHFEHLSIFRKNCRCNCIVFIFWNNVKIGKFIDEPKIFELLSLELKSQTVFLLLGQDGKT